MVGWFIYQPVGGEVEGIYTAGVGYQTRNAVNRYNQKITIVNIRYNFAAPVAFKSLTVTYDYSIGNSTALSSNKFWVYVGSESQNYAYNRTEGLDFQGINLTHTWFFGGTHNEVFIQFLTCGAWDVATDDGYATIKKAVFKGAGINPFT